MRRRIVAAFRPPRRVAGALWVLSPLLVPLPAVAWVRRWNGWTFRMIARFWCRWLGFRQPVLINYVPVLAEAMRGWGGRRPRGDRRVRVVYHCVDRWDKFDMYDSALMADMDRRCACYADLVMASSSDLYERARRWNAHTHIVLHGVNWEHFAGPLGGSGPGMAAASDRVLPRPADLPDGPIVGFFGLLSEWVDQDLLVRLARELRDDTHVRGSAGVVLIGKADVPVERLAAEPNIHLLGPRPFAVLPAYVAHFDVGIIPFVVNELTRAVNPIKLREMLAAGCPVVSTSLPEVAAYAGDARSGGGVASVVVASHAGDFIAAVRRAVAAPPAIDARRAISDTIRGETWAAKVGEIVGLIEAGLPPPGPSASVSVDPARGEGAAI